METYYSEAFIVRLGSPISQIFSPSGEQLEHRKLVHEL